MSVHTNVGKISVSPKGALWTLSDFSSLHQMSDTVIFSPYFAYGKRRWRLSVDPNGCSSLSTLGWFGIVAGNLADKDELIVELGITNEHQEYIVSDRSIHKIIDGNTYYSCQKLISRTDCDSRKNEIMPKGNLHILLRIVSEMEESTVHTVRNETEDDDLRLKQDFERMLLNESITDVVLKVQGQEFRAHRFVLAARSPVFLAMMSHDTKEKATGIVDIEDGDPNYFPDFLHFLYTGNVESLTSKNALALHSLADKYQVTGLKEICTRILLTTISVENFCDVITLSLQHNETNLKDACITFFQEKSLDIVMTTNWQTFLSENPIIGNELFIKHLQMIKSKHCEK